MLLKRLAMNRKTFIKKTAGALLIALPAYSILSCSSSSDDSGSNNTGGGTANCLQNGARASSISGNHGHSLTVSKADVSAGAEKTYSISGSSGHSHSVTVSAANFNTLKSNQPVNVTSTSGNSHTHSVTISCA